VTIDDGSKPQVLDTLAKRTFIADGELAEQGAVFEIGTTHIAQATLFDLGEGDLEALNLAPRVTVERTRSGHDKREKSSKAEYKELHSNVFVCLEL
ncbi:hypothetical protein BGZ80_011736, partial [Entomortierella chlamydospora]